MDTQANTDAARARRYRGRQREGVRVFRIAANEAALAQALIDARLLKAELIENSPAIAHAAQKLVDIFVRDDK